MSSIRNIDSIPVSEELEYYQGNNGFNYEDNMDSFEGKNDLMPKQKVEIYSQLSQPNHSHKIGSDKKKLRSIKVNRFSAFSKYLQNLTYFLEEEEKKIKVLQ